MNHLTPRWRTCAGSCAVLLSTVVLLHATVSAQTAAPSAQAAASTQSDDDAINPDRPGIADGSSVVGRGRLQIETGFQYENHDEGDSTERTHSVPTLVRVGLSDRWEARIEGNTYTGVSASTAGSPSTRISGLAPVSIGAKLHLQDSAGSGQPSLGAIFRVFPPSGSGGLRSTRTAGDVRFVADWDVTSSVSLNPNIGLGIYEDDAGGRFAAGLAALTLSYVNAAKTLNPFIDVGVQAPEAPHAGASIILDAGVAWIPERDLQIDVSAGTGAHGDSAPHPFVAVGVSLRFRAAH